MIGRSAGASAQRECVKNEWRGRLELRIFTGFILEWRNFWASNTSGGKEKGALSRVRVKQCSISNADSVDDPHRSFEM